MNILITGTSRGIGKAILQNLIAGKDGHTIFAVARTPQESLTENPNVVIPIQFDLGFPEAVFHSQLLPQIEKHVQSLDIIINNAGIFAAKPFEKFSITQWQHIFSTNTLSAVKVIKTCLPLLKQSTSAHIVNISSMGGFQGSQKFPGLSAYSASKAALANLTEVLAAEFAPHNIAINCLCPGAVDTEMFSAAFPGQQAQVSAKTIAAFIASFALTGHKACNGKIIPLSISTP